MLPGLSQGSRSTSGKSSNVDTAQMSAKKTGSDDTLEVC